MKIKPCPVFPGISTSKIPTEFSLSGGMCRGMWFLSVILSLCAMGFSWEPDIFEQQGAWKRKETAVSCKKRTKQEILISISYSVITMRTFDSDRLKATIIEARGNVYGHAGRITTCFLTLGHRRWKTSVIFPPQMSPVYWRCPWNFRNNHTGVAAHAGC